MSRAGIDWLSRLAPGTAVYTPDGARWDMLDLLAAAGPPRVDLAVTLGVRHRLPARLLAVRVPEEVANQRRRRVREEATRRGKTPSAAQLAWACWTMVVTNVPCALLSLQEALVLLRARWQMELLFKLWKSHGHIDASRSASPGASWLRFSPSSSPSSSPSASPSPRPAPRRAPRHGRPALAPPHRLLGIPRTAPSSKRPRRCVSTPCTWPAPSRARPSSATRSALSSAALPPAVVSTAGTRSPIPTNYCSILPWEAYPDAYGGRPIDAAEVRVFCCPWDENGGSMSATIHDLRRGRAARRAPNASGALADSPERGGACAARARRPDGALRERGGLTSVPARSVVRPPPLAQRPRRADRESQRSTSSVQRRGRKSMSHDSSP